VCDQWLLPEGTRAASLLRALLAIVACRRNGQPTATGYPEGCPMTHWAHPDEPSGAPTALPLNFWYPAALLGSLTGLLGMLLAILGKWRRRECDIHGRRTASHRTRAEYVAFGASCDAGSRASGP
jgi:hypothetical protein